MLPSHTAVLVQDKCGFDPCIPNYWLSLVIRIWKLKKLQETFKWL